MNFFPAVDIIIPHYKGTEYINNCIQSVVQTAYPNFNIYIIDNGSTDDSLEFIKKKYFNVFIHRLEINVGYTGAINMGYQITRNPYVVFLSDDVEVDANWLSPMVTLAEDNKLIGAMQPKILSIQKHKMGIEAFDYAGAAGGRMDKLCYPFAYGRTFFKIENDVGQYNFVQQIFWASGAAMFVRRSAIEEVGIPFDHDFFAHMEEIDLSWRLQSRGYLIYASPSSKIYHVGGATINFNSEKIFLNHRNNISMIIKNKEHLKITLLIRFILEAATILYYIMLGKKEHASAVYRALRWNIANHKKNFVKRQELKSKRIVSDRMIFQNSPLSVFLMKSK